MDEIISTELEEKLLAELPRTIDHYTPEIFWHDRKQIMCLHIQQTMPDDQYVSDEGRRCDLRYKLCTVSVQDEVRVWEIVFSKSKHPGFENHYEMGVNFVANLVGHNSTLNVVQYSPDGRLNEFSFNKFQLLGQLIASGDVNGKMIIWKIYPHDENFVESEHKPLNDESAQFEIPPNKENWLRAFMPIGHDNDLNALAFSPNSQFICSAAHDDLRLTNARTGKAGWYNRNFRRLITGLTWDPRGRYIVTMSSDRRMDIVDAYKGYRLRTCHAHTIPEMVIDNKRFEMRVFFLTSLINSSAV
jgi:WD40 repeat protein